MWERRLGSRWYGRMPALPLPRYILSAHCSFKFLDDEITRPSTRQLRLARFRLRSFEERGDEVKRRVIDSLGCALGAWNETPCEIARKVVSDIFGNEWGDRDRNFQKAPPDWAAFAERLLHATSITMTLTFRKTSASER